MTYSLYERLTGRRNDGSFDDFLPKIAILEFSAMLGEKEYASFSTQDFIDRFSLVDNQPAELNEILLKYNNASNKKEIVTRILNIFILAERNHPDYGLPTQLQSVIMAI